MIKFLLFISVFIALLEARENPFFPSDGEKDMIYTSNKGVALPTLKRATIELPSYARVLKKVTIEYKNLDGSIEKKSIELDSAVDWHLPIFISQSYTAYSNKNRTTKKLKYKKVATIKYASFYISGKSLKVITKDKAIRNFLLVEPHRIVVDFKRDASLKSLVKNIKNSVFTKIRVGNHDGYYRAVIELDGYYRYKMKKINNGYIFTLR